MKLFTIIVGTLAAMSTASAVLPKEEQELVARDNQDFVSDLVEKFIKFPGAKELKGVWRCFKKDKTWKADWSQTQQGVATFSSVSPKCCNMAKKAWTKYEKDWIPFGVAMFSTPCAGGQVSGMKPAFAEEFHSLLGDGH